MPVTVISTTRVQETYILQRVSFRLTCETIWDPPLASCHPALLVKSKGRRVRTAKNLNTQKKSPAEASGALRRTAGRTYRGHRETMGF